MSVQQTINPKDAYQANQYRGNGSKTTYQHESGMMVFPLQEVQSGTNPPVAIVFLHQPYRIRNYSSSASRALTPPTIACASSNDKDIFLAGSVSFDLPTIDTGRATLIWSAQTDLTYIERESWDIQDGYRIGDFPFDTTPIDLEGVGYAARNVDGFGETLGTSVGNSQGNNSVYNDHLHYPSVWLSNEVAQGN